MQANVLESDRNIFGQTQRSPEIEIAFGPEQGVPQHDAK